MNAVTVQVRFVVRFRRLVGNWGYDRPEYFESVQHRFEHGKKKETIMLPLLLCAMLNAPIFFYSPAQGPVPVQVSAPAIAHATIHSGAKVHIVDVDGKETVIPPQKEQVGVASLTIAGDHRTAGWLAEFPNCCTSYPVALTLIIYRDGKVIHRLHNGTLILNNWRFLDGGKRVSFATNTVHGDFAPHYEMHDVLSGRLLEKWDGHITEKSPKWVKELSE